MIFSGFWIRESAFRLKVASSSASLALDASSQTIGLESALNCKKTKDRDPSRSLPTGFRSAAIQPAGSV